MNIEINENNCSGIIKYCNKNNVNFIKIIEESIIQNQLRHNIDYEGNIYENKYYEIPDKIILENLLKNIFCETDGNITEELFGRIYENIPIKNCKYLIGDYKNNYKIVFITTDDKRIDEIKNCKEIENLKIEENQAYSWVTAYKTKIIYKDTGDCKILLLTKG